MNTKKQVIHLINQLPEDVTLDQIMDELYTRLKIEKGIRELDDDKAISHEMVKERMNKWLN